MQGSVIEKGGRDLLLLSVGSSCLASLILTADSCLVSTGMELDFNRAFVQYFTPFHLTQCFCLVEVVRELSAQMGKWVTGQHLYFEKQHMIVMTAALCGS